MRFTVLIFLGIFLFSVTTVHSQYVDCNEFMFRDKRDFKVLRHSIVRLGEHGAAFLVDPNTGLFFSALHVVKKFKNGIKGTAHLEDHPQSVEVAFKIVDANDDFDFVALRIDGENIFKNSIPFEVAESCKNSGLGFFNIADATAGPGEILSPKFPDSLELKTVMLADNKCRTENAPACCRTPYKCYITSDDQLPGDSGGPLFDEFGVVHAFMTARQRERGFAVPLGYLRNDFQEIGNKLYSNDKANENVIQKFILNLKHRKDDIFAMKSLLKPHSKDGISNLQLFFAIDKIIKTESEKRLSDGTAKEVFCAADDRRLRASADQIQSNFNINFFDRSYDFGLSNDNEWQYRQIAEVTIKGKDSPVASKLPFKSEVALLATANEGYRLSVASAMEKDKAPGLVNALADPLPPDQVKTNKYLQTATLKTEETKKSSIFSATLHGYVSSGVKLYYATKTEQNDNIKFGYKWDDIFGAAAWSVLVSENSKQKELTLKEFANVCRLSGDQKTRVSILSRLFIDQKESNKSAKASKLSSFSALQAALGDYTGRSVYFSSIDENKEKEIIRLAKAEAISDKKLAEFALPFATKVYSVALKKVGNI